MGERNLRMDNMKFAPFSFNPSATEKSVLFI